MGVKLGERSCRRCSKSCGGMRCLGTTTSGDGATWSHVTLLLGRAQQSEVCFVRAHSMWQGNGGQQGAIVRVAQAQPQKKLWIKNCSNALSPCHEPPKYPGMS